MTKKKKADLANVFGDVGATEADMVVPVATNQQPTTVRKTPAPQRNSIYYPPGVLLALKQLALTEGVKVNDLLVEGIDTVFEKRGLPSVEQVSARK